MFRPFLLILSISLFLYSCGNSSDHDDSPNLNIELVIQDSIQVDIMEGITAIDFNGDYGTAFSMGSRKITLFDFNGNIIKSKTFPQDGPGLIGFVTDLKILENGKTILYPFNSQKLTLLDENLEVERYIEMPFASELQGAAYFQHMFAVHEDDVFLFYPGRDGGVPYFKDFYKNHNLLEKLSLTSETSEGVFKLPSNSKYLSELTYEYPMVTVSAGDGLIYVALDTESFIHVFDPNSKEKPRESLDFSPTKFVQMEGNKEEFVSSYGKQLRGEVKNLHAVPGGVVVNYTEGIEEEVYQREELHERENWYRRPDFNQNLLKAYIHGEGWSNEVKVPSQMMALAGITGLDQDFWALRNDDYVGEEQDYLTFYRLQLKRK